MEKLKSLWKKISEFFFGKEAETTKSTSGLLMDSNVKIQAPTLTFTPSAPSASTIVLPSAGQPTIVTTSSNPVINTTTSVASGAHTSKVITVKNDVATIKFTEVDHTVKSEKKAPIKKTPVKKTPAKKAPAKKAIAKKAQAKKIVTKKAPAKKVVTKKAPAKKASIKKINKKK